MKPYGLGLGCPYGPIWSHTVPYGLIRCLVRPSHKCPYGSIRAHTVPIRSHKCPYGPILRSHKSPHGPIRCPYGPIRCLVRPLNLALGTFTLRTVHPKLNSLYGPLYSSAPNVLSPSSAMLYLFALLCHTTSRPIPY